MSLLKSLISSKFKKLFWDKIAKNFIEVFHLMLLPTSSECDWISVLKRKINLNGQLQSACKHRVFKFAL